MQPSVPSKVGLVLFGREVGGISSSFIIQYRGEGEGGESYRSKFWNCACSECVF